ncbi:UbiD family decarboxylase [Clostridium saccharoperbutylacetonicum]|uniref:3-octaprenyl-4-hydroxybenzoate carboxy-lyase n=2 Tax=Clostridium TaxID=1485 RepID=M1M0D0_9CLOT|nr:UbiD family decarboxylase [Clostridium saccharoperbutylacetonicum]AGF59045.1 3-octaprenyl-4-hydroxybenzoate carboxy-lyase [Clostridium saccharoperbutylacetonicum N1-4(HMT)]AQR97714.1 phenolic acid decarboxylase subunit C [Clostridium saccharoperbutylacetonicum]NRT60167.1 4-hydroxy-3-polyprenylbenzoate decarboxylase [Clostridium saccharoperbutylacetonicum]NSB23479.1 4-hydroxy-3-polyprenylbenzoate decarboxylase [Clostridium saccharoperbutylacetonicum]NSB33602.1 4-hydroxy-3-polyprenylbenzoate 
MSTERSKITDLRSALERLKGVPGQLIETSEEADPNAEISGVYRYIGAGGTVMRPTRIGPAMIFNNVKGHEDARVLIGLLASRERVGLMLDSKPERLGFLLNEAVKHPIQPIVIKEKPKCQEVVHYADEPGFDIRKLVPAPTNTEEDAGPYITLGMCYASDPENGDSDITIHRLCLQSKDEMSMFFTPGARHLGVFREKAEKLGKPLPISISIGVDPAIEIAACFEPPTTPIGFNELSIAGAIRNKAVELTQCLTIDERAIANAEYVIEGELIPNVRIREDQNSNTGKAMPEFPGYTGPACDEIPVIKVKAVTHRINPIMQTCIGPSEEHVSMAGIPTEASILQMVEKAMPGRLLNVYAHSSGGGKYMAILQFKKSQPSDEGRQRQAALLAFSAFSELKHVIIVDEDVDPFDSNDVMWALNTRYQGDVDTIFIPGVRCHPLDPSQDPEYSSSIKDKGISCKTIFDCTVPYALKDKFQRAKFKDVDPARFAPELFKSEANK